MHARELRWSLIGALAAVTVACANNSLAPSEKAEVLPGGAPNLLITIHEMAADQSSAEFTVTPSGGYFQMGKHGIVFPRNVICDPATSTYGPEFWDDDCRVLREPLRIRAELRQQDGREWVDFKPDLRFRPSPRATAWVWIYMRTDAAAGLPDRSLNILWSPAIGVPGVDESIDDPTLRTFVSPWSGYAYRRVKHFSGYNVTSGYTSVPTDLRERAPAY
ncbi:MAG: hypothetical protein ACT4PJ_01985 [Gemmatimonadaceae bacterium]